MSFAVCRVIRTFVGDICNSYLLYHTVTLRTLSWVATYRYRYYHCYNDFWVEYHRFTLIPAYRYLPSVLRLRGTETRILPHVRWDSLSKFKPLFTCPQSRTESPRELTTSAQTKARQIAQMHHRNRPHLQSLARHHEGLRRPPPLDRAELTSPGISCT